MVDVETNRKIQVLVAQEIVIQQELQKKSEALRTALLSSERFHRDDLLKFAIQKAAKAEAQLEVSCEQIETLAAELQNANQELESYRQELNVCHQDMGRLEEEVWKLTFNQHEGTRIE